MESWPVSKNILWRVRLFDGPKLETHEGEESVRFKSQRVGALLAYLALKLGRPCSREELAYALWPEEEDSHATANRLRVALASLRRQMEPPGTPFGSVLDVSQAGCIRLRAETVWCDVTAFEQALKAGQQEEAAHLLQGELLPNYYEDWAILQQQRFASLREDLEPLMLAEETLLPRERSRQEVFVPAFLPTAPRYPLPLYLTHYYGREAEQEQLRESFCENRLVTIIGPGGMGKTRLAVEVANQMRSPSVFVSLAEREAASVVPEAILQALRVLPNAHTDLVEQVIIALDRQGSPLLILDNVEHLLEAVATLILRLLEALPDLQIMVTSRQRLDIVGETLFPLTSLESPTPNLPYQHLMVVPAVALFLDRARRVRPDFTLTARYAPDIVQICHQVEGVPLALELAAVRVTQQTPAQITADLANNLLILKSRQRGLAKRHQSLRATLQGSFNLLTPNQQKFFADLSVFQGGWTAEAARAITQFVETEEFLEDLLARSLIVTKEETGRGVMRYSFLETIRQFATEQLSVEQLPLLTAHHSVYFLHLAASAWEDDIRTFAPLDGEKENLLKALETGWEQLDTAFWDGLIGALRYMFIRGQHRIALPWVERALSQVSQIGDTMISSRLREIILNLMIDIGRMEEARKIAQEMQAEGETRGDLVTVNLAAIRLGYIENELGNFERAVQIQREVLQQAHLLDNPALLKHSLSMTARALVGYAFSLGFETASGRETLEEAVALGQECLALMSPHSCSISLLQLLFAVSYGHLNRVEEAYTTLKASQQTALAHDSQTILMYGFYHEGFTALKAGHFAYAALLHGAFQNIQERMGYSISSSDTSLQSFQTELIGHLGKDTFENLVLLGRRTPPQDLVASSLDNLPDCCGLAP